MKKKQERPTAKPSPQFLKHQRNMRSEVRRLAANITTRSDITELRTEVVELRAELRELRDALGPLIDAGWLKKWSQKMQGEITKGANGGST